MDHVCKSPKGQPEGWGLHERVKVCVLQNGVLPLSEVKLVRSMGCIWAQCLTLLFFRPPLPPYCQLVALLTQAIGPVVQEQGGLDQEERAKVV